MRSCAQSSDTHAFAWAWLKPIAAGVIALGLAACAQVRPYVPPSEGHIVQQAKPAPTAAPEIPPPARVSSFVPPPQPAVKPQTYSVVVNEVPVKELLNALARDTRQNIDIHPTISGVVSLNAIDETLPAILERISKQVDIRYRMEGNTIIVSPDMPYVKTYVVNYVNIQRNTTSTTGASGQIGTAGGESSSGGSSSGGSTGTAGNTSMTTVTTTSSSDFWRLLEQAVRAILNSALQQSLSAEAKQQRLQTIRQEQELRVKQLEATSRGAALPAGTPAPGRAAGGPVTPVTLRGPRSILRGNTWFPRRGAIRIVISPSLTPAGQDWNAAIQLRDAVRKEILAQCGEPDLAG